MVELCPSQNTAKIIVVQKDYVNRKRAARRATPSIEGRKKSGSVKLLKNMLKLTATLLIIFISTLYFIIQNKHNGRTLIKVLSNHTTSYLLPKPEERWQHIKELENGQIGVHTIQESSTVNNVIQTQSLLKKELD